jgi:hypothetical protein
MKIKSRSEEELHNILTSWKMNDDGILTWARNTNRNKKIGEPVGLSTKKSGHINCFLYINKKIYGYSVCQVAWFLYYKEWPRGEIDHIDCNPKNNKKENLRIATRSEQSQNKRFGKINRKNKGVYKRSYGDRWTAQIWKDGKAFNLGTFNSEQDAIQARIIAAKELHGDFANLQSYT